jgi:hypothetical protein
MTNTSTGMVGKQEVHRKAPYLPRTTYTVEIESQGLDLSRVHYLPFVPSQHKDDVKTMNPILITGASIDAQTPICSA